MEEVVQTQDPSTQNALNLINNKLGQAFVQEGYNPLGKDFELSEKFVLKTLENKKNCQQTFDVDFLNFDNAKIKKHFATALQNGEQIAKVLIEQSVGFGEEEISSELEYSKLYMTNRNKMLALAIESLKNKNQNSLELFAEIYNLDCQLSEVLQESFYENFKSQEAIEKIIAAIKARAMGTRKQQKLLQTAIQENNKIIAKQSEQALKSTKTQQKAMAKAREQEK